MKDYIGKTVSDIVLAGVVDPEDSTFCMSVNHEFLFIELDGDGWIKLSSAEQMSLLDVCHQQELSFDFEIDEDDQYASVSVKDMILVDTVSDSNITEVNKFLCDGKLKAVEMIFSTGQSIFIDATYYTGIKVGEEALKKAFSENNKGFEIV